MPTDCCQETGSGSAYGVALRGLQECCLLSPIVPVRDARISALPSWSQDMRISAPCSKAFDSSVLFGLTQQPFCL